MSNPNQPTVRRNHMPRGLILTGIPIAIIGGVIMAVASSKSNHARMVGDLTEAMGGPGGYNVDLESAVTLGHWGLGVLILGVVIVLIGIAALAVRRA